MSETHAVPALSVGVAVGGTTSDARHWGDASMALARDVKSLRQGVKSPLNVNVVFHVTGEVSPVDFAGVRTGRYAANERLLLVQAAVPGDAPTVNSRLVLVTLLQDAIEQAEAFAHRKSISDEPLEALRGLVAQVREAQL